MGWCSITTDQDNNRGKDLKFINKQFNATGVSLGSPGGYIQFEFDQAIRNRHDSPYGMDFVIYGNAFNGNPEAGSVQVSQDGETWYELAGSLYYREETQRNIDLSYQLRNTNKDIFYKLGNLDYSPYGGGSNKSWWPYLTDRNYDKVSGINIPYTGSKAVNYASLASSPDHAKGQINYGVANGTKVTLVRDTDNTDDYQFGYVDIRRNGTEAKDGTIYHNPYADSPSKQSGGDVFDLSWAVTPDGRPANLDSAKFIRIYTSAGLNPENMTQLPIPGIFGETSTEVCGAFVAKGTGSPAQSHNLKIENGKTILPKNGEVIKVEKSSVQVTCDSGANLLVDGQRILGNGSTIEGKGIHQVIVQADDEAAYIVYVELK